jgi:opacity protein-like surface antigen
MRSILARAAALALISAVAAAPAAAQSIHLSGLGGIYKPDSDLFDLRDDVTQGRLSKNDAAAFGLNLEIFGFRGSLVYAPGATLEEQTSGGADRDVGESSLLAVAGDLALRPLPRIIGIQPYALAGVGLKRFGYDITSDGIGNALPEDETEFAIHFGLGADFMFGDRFGLVLEATDFFTVGDAEFGRNATFLLAGVRMRVN